MTNEIKHPCPACNGSGETGKPHEPAHVHPRYCSGCCPSCLGQKRASVSDVGAQARVERAESARDAFEGRAKTAEIQSETHARIATSLQARIRDIHTKVCGDDAGLGSPDEHHVAILAEFVRLREAMPTERVLLMLATAIPHHPLFSQAMRDECTDAIERMATEIGVPRLDAARNSTEVG